MDQTLNWIDCGDLNLDWNLILNIDKKFSVKQSQYDMSIKIFQILLKFYENQGVWKNLLNNSKQKTFWGNSKSDARRVGKEEQ